MNKKKIKIVIRLSGKEIIVERYIKRIQEEDEYLRIQSIIRQMEKRKLNYEFSSIFYPY